MGAKLTKGIQERWREGRAVELAIEEVAAGFDGEDPALPKERRALEEIKKRVEELHRDAQAHVGPFELPEPEEQDLEQARDIIRREKKRYE